jgi:uncharacterized protein
MAEASPIPEPTRRLAGQARWVWRIYWALGSAVVLVAGALAGDGAPDPLPALLWALPLASLLIGTPVVPELRWRRWRWEVREGEIDLQRGLLVVRRTLIPMGRVQHVESERGVIEQSLGLASVEIHTAAGSHRIPLLSDRDAGLLRARIAELARTDDDGEHPREATAAAPADDG